MEKNLSQQVFSNSLMVMIIGLGTQIIAFLIMSMTAKKFGVSLSTDAYFLAFTIISAIINIIGGGLRIVALPIFVREKINNNNRLIYEIINFCILIVIVSLIIGIIFFLSFFSKSLFTKNEVLLSNEYKINLFILFPTIPLNLIRNLFIVLYASNQKFIFAEFSNIVLQIIIFVILLIFSNYGIVVLSIAHLVGSITSLIFIIFIIKKEFYNFYIKRFKIGELNTEIIKLLPFPLIAYGLFNLDVLSTKYFSSMIGIGLTTILDYGFKLSVIPSTIIGIGPFEVIFSYWSKLENENDYTRMSRGFIKSLLLILFVILPMVVGLYFLSEDLVKILFFNGKFVDADVLRTVEVLKILVWSVISSSVFTLFLRVFYTKQNMKMVVFISFIKSFLTIILCYVLSIIIPLGLEGIAISYVISSIITTIFAGHYINKNYIKFFSKEIIKPIFQVMFSLTIMISTIIFCISFMKTYEIILRIILIPTISSVVYFSVLYVIKNEQLSFIINSLRRKKSFVQ